MSEQLYDEKIGPALLKLAKQCQDAGISMVAVVEYEPGETATTVALEEKHSLVMDWCYMASRSKKNADALILGMMKQAGEVGHNSLCLQQLGVPTTPEN